MSQRAATERFDLDGGTVVLVEPFHAIPLVSIVVALRSGAAHDPPGKGGLTRLAMRMLRRGCEGMTAEQIEAAIDRLGAEMAVDTGASTVAVHAQVIGRSLDAFVDLLARLLSTPTFPADELERLERESVAEIIESRDNDRVVAQRAFQRAFFPDHPYGRTATGTTQSVASIGRDDAVAFWQRHVVRGNIVVGFAGDVDGKTAAKLAERLVVGVAAGAALADPVPPPAMQTGRRLLFVDKPERTQTQILVATLGTSPHDADHAALGVANAIFGGTFTSRLMKEVRSKRGWSYGAYSRLGIDRQRQAFSLWTFPGADDAAKCLALELELYEKFVAGGITARELGFIKRYLTRSHAFEIDTAAKRLHQALDIELLTLPSDYYSRYLEHVDAVTLEAANKAVRARLSVDDLLSVVVGTSSQILEPIRACIPRLASHEVVAFDAE